MSPLFTALEFLAQTPPPGQPQAPSAWVQIMPMVLLFGAMYFFMIAPQRKKQKEHARMLAALQTGDEVITNGGIYGTITNVKDDRFVVRIADNTKIEIGKGFIQTVLKRTDATAEKK